MLNTIFLWIQLTAIVCEAGSYIFFIFLYVQRLYDVPISYVENDFFMAIADN